MRNNTMSNQTAWRGLFAMLFTGIGLLFSAGIILLIIQTLFNPERLELKKFHCEQIQPIIEKYHAQDLADLERFLLQAESVFQSYAAGVDPFVNDMTGLIARFGLAGRWIGDAYDKHLHGRDAHRVATYVEESFRKHVVSPRRLEHDLLLLINELGYGLEANQNMMLGEIREAVAYSELFLEAEAFEAARFQEMIRLNAPQFRNMGTSSAALAVVDIAGLAIFAKCARGGKVGVIIGIIAGITVEWLSSKKVKSNLRQASLKIVDDLRRTVIHDSHTGLQVVLGKTLKELHQVRAKVIADTITRS